jgi:hypothetical protein
MDPKRGLALLVLAGFLLQAGPAPGQDGRDGRRFDPAAGMSARSAAAPEELDLVASYIGYWDVEYRVMKDGVPVHRARGEAEVTYMNRGHSVMERFACLDFNGQGEELRTISFLTYSPTSEMWILGVASGYTENISVFNGDFEEGELVLENAIRRRGGPRVTHYRVRTETESEDLLRVILEESMDGQEPWVPQVVKAYRRRKDAPPLLARAADYGSPGPDRPEEAGQFDFLIGEWDEQHELKRPDGPIRFPAHGTAIHCLGGRAIMEYSWYDVDPSHPEAATTIVRIYNRVMRRWECLYHTNRANSLLWFGGVREGDRIVLHQFEANATDTPFSYWIFHDMKPDRYSWHADTSRDRGRTFEPTWIIEGTRKTGN